MALEHCDNPFMELKELYRSLKKNGKICIVVPCDNIKYKFTVTEEGKEPEEKESMSFKKLLKSIVNTNPKWTGSLNYNNKKGREVTHNILRGKRI